MGGEVAERIIKMFDEGQPQFIFTGNYKVDCRNKWLR